MDDAVVASAAMATAAWIRTATAELKFAWPAQSTKHSNNIIKLIFSLYFQYIQLWKIVTAFLKESKHILLINCWTLLAAAALLCASPVSPVIQSIYFAIHKIWFANCVLERSLECIYCSHKNVWKCESCWTFKELLDPLNLSANS